jgi:predicted AAA+ superfamily ATPase
MDVAKIEAALCRIAEALERLAPPAAPEPTFGESRFYRHDAASGVFRPAPDFPLPLDLLIGVDRQKARLLEVIERFAAGLPANHVLLWGARGAGKSALAKAVFMAVAARDPALRMVEVEGGAVTVLPAVFEGFRARTERFVVLCDDLSFEEGAMAAKALKSALEGGVAGPPPNVLFLATSNRRHLMPRARAEADGPLAAAEDTEEEVSVSDRFGAWIGFGPMDQAAYLAAVRGYAERFNLSTPELERRALQWAKIRGSRSGRVAWQFIRELAGELDSVLPL